MTEQLDWVGETAGMAGFKDIRNQRHGVAEEKAALCLRLGELCNKVPRSVRDGSVNLTREWKAERAKAMKVAGSSRSSVNELTAAISSMGRFA